MGNVFGVASQDANVFALSLQSGEKLKSTGLRGRLMGNLYFNIGELLLAFSKLIWGKAIKRFEDGFIGRKAEGKTNGGEIVEAFGEGAVHVENPGSTGREHEEKDERWFKILRLMTDAQTHRETYDYD